LGKSADKANARHAINDRPPVHGIASGLDGNACLRELGIERRAPADKGEQRMEIKRRVAVEDGPAKQFTGSVKIDHLFAASPPAAAAWRAVTFEPRARTAWHTHPNGQILIVTAGLGRVQVEGKPIEDIRPGDVVLISAGEKHWHGASPTAAMTHVAINEAPTNWMDKVTDEQYGA
jgi:quercetin dioxygenase-like cupin family protein